MLSKNQIKYITSLQQKKFRKQHNCFLAEGTKVVVDLLESSLNVKSVYALKEWIISNKSKVPLQTELIEISEDELKKISELITPNQVLAIIEIPDIQLETGALKGNYSLMLDDIKDPGNMGTIIRLADWFGIKNIIASENSVDCFNSKVVQSTMGSISRVNVHYTDLVLFAGELIKMNLPILTTALEGENIYNSELPKEGVIVMGNESKGVSQDLMDLATIKLYIPSFNTALQKAESLNVAIATAIVCSEVSRR